MKIADLYIRVSTDEQADKGYSQRDQEDRLRRYCQIQNIEVRKVIYEDHSERPLTVRNGISTCFSCKKIKNTADLVLFIKRDMKWAFETLVLNYYSTRCRMFWMVVKDTIDQCSWRIPRCH